MCLCNVAHEYKHPTRKAGKQQRGKTRAVPDLVFDSEEDDVVELWGDSWGEGGNDNVVATPVCALPVASPSHLHPAPPSHHPLHLAAPHSPPPSSDAAHVDSPLFIITLMNSSSYILGFFFLVLLLLVTDACAVCQ